MKLANLITVAFATLAVNADSSDLRQIVFDKKPSIQGLDFNVFEKLKQSLNYPKEGQLEVITEAWESLQKDFSAKQLLKKVEDFQSNLAKKLNNKLSNSKFYQTSKEFHVLSNDKFTDYSLSVKKNNPEALGLDTVEQYTGYLNVDSLDKHFFFWFFESRNDPKTDPLILWLNGGPGCSSSTGLFFELGPSSINATIQPVYNPHSWNSNASIIFLDQPVGVGYSYTGGEEVKSTAAAAKDFYVFLELFFQKFPQFLSNDFHIAGESYGGHYIPKFASEILNNADRSFELKSVMIGNGITDPLIQYKYYKPMGCGEGGYKPVLSEEQCDQLDKDFPKCAALIKACYTFQNALTCVPATVYCERAIYGPYDSTGLNPYDIRRKCDEEGGECYVGMTYIDEFLNNEFVKTSVGAEVDIFTSCDDKVFINFILDGDEQKPFQQYVAELLEKDVPVLLYAGDKDYICNWLGNHAWSDALEYSGHDSFAAESLKPWITLDGKEAGQVKNFEKFTFLRIFDAGHMVPYDQPENALDMVNRWIQGDYSFGY